MNLARHDQLGVELHLAIFLRGVKRYFTELPSAFSETQNSVYKHRELGKHLFDAKTYCKFLFNSLNAAYRVEISFTLTPQFSE